MPTTVKAAPGEPLPWTGYRALIFDWDGTLVNSHGANYQAMAAALNAQGARMEKVWFDARTGLSTPEMASLISGEQNIDLNLDQIVSARNSEYMQLLESVREIVPVVNVLREASAAGVLTALATGGGKATVMPSVDELGLRDLFNVIVTREDAERGKPAPDIFLTAAKRLEVSPADCLVFEDSEEGLAAAQHAGMDSVDVRALRGTVA
ncbi:HAD family hydrolase [Arthrobacter sp. LAR12-1-1.1]|uniref:HAD family hydrolase n=1 Tax=Arthrobacter sp. LAR12-1-1.1 TaxID=3135215 RepID=UPI003413DD32